MNNEGQRRDLFPPSDFIPTAVVFGFWTSGVMAGLNLTRAGLAQHGKRLIRLSIGAMAAMWLGLTWAAWLTHPSGISGVCIPWMWAIAVLGNLAIGWVLYRSQRGLYAEWRASHSPGDFSDPYGGSSIRQLVTLGLIVLYLVLGLILWFMGTLH